MANLHAQFQKFHERVALTPGKKESLRTSRDAIRHRIRRYFKENLKVEAPNFHAQGSFEMATIVNPLNGEFDIDDGVHLQHLDKSNEGEWPAPETVHKWLVDATEGYTDEKPIDKRTCVRVRYAGEYHVDLPSYADNGQCMLAEKGEAGWHRSDPAGLTDWFRDKVAEHGEQARRLVRYFKAWADYQSEKRGKMPNGLILTVLVVHNFRADDKDDVSLGKTARAMSDAVKQVFRVYNPVDNEEEITARLSEEEKKRFQEAMADLANDASKALDTASEEEASKLWCGQLGDRFPMIEEGEKEKEGKQKREDAVRVAAFYTPKNPIKPWGWT